MKNNALFPLLIAGAFALLLLRKPTTPSAPTINTDAQRDALIYTSGAPADVVNKIMQMSAAEINAVYQYIFNYWKKGLTVPDKSPLFYSMQAISTKYNIFT